MMGVKMRIENRILIEIPITNTYDLATNLARNCTKRTKQ